jgi:hypothetical protein
MPTASPPEALPRPPFVGVDPQVMVARWSGAILAAWTPFALLPASVLPNPVPLAVVFACVCAVLLAGIPGGKLRTDLVTPISIAFVGVGILYIGASLLQVLPIGPEWSFRNEFVPRHSYYLLVWLPLMGGAVALFRNVMSDLLVWVGRLGAGFLAFLAIADVAFAYLWGVQERMTWEGYVPFFDPPFMNFLYSMTFFLYVGVTRRIVLPLAIVSLHGLVSGMTDHGTIYNTMTGSFVVACMFLFALVVRRRPVLTLFGLFALGAGLFLVLIVGTLAPEVLGFDVNTQWRFLVWRENLFSALQTGLLGVGFGTPYFPLTSGNIAEAYRLAKYAEFTQYALGNPTDLLYIRGQHSSFVNAFYRMGLAGGGLLIAFNFAVLVLLVKAIRRASADFAPIIAAVGAIFLVENCQIAMHVGLESPRYLAAYALAVGLARAAAQLALRRDA